MKLTHSSSKRIRIVAILSAVGLALPAFATDVDFEGFSGPTLFSGATPAPQTIVTDGATFTGGVILTAATNLPADETSLYGTADFSSGLSNPITVTDPDGFNNFFFDLLNGETAPQSFVVADNAGHSQEFDNIPANTDSGFALVGFASTGTVVTITDITSGASGPYDFFIDNVHFDEGLPPSLGGNSVPDGASTAELLAVGALGLVALAYRRRATA
jgi:hypothetical protein